jgi:hypothetical protein
MLVAEAEALKGLVAKYRAAESEKTQLQKLRLRSEQLAALRSRVHTLRVGSDLLKRRRLRCATVPALAENVLNVVSKLIALAPKPGALGGNEAAPHFSALTKNSTLALEQMETALLGVWQTFVDEQVGKYDIAILADWDHVPDFRAVARNIRSIQSKFANLRGRIPVDDEDFSRVQELGQQLKTAWKQLENTPPKVLRFLREASAPAGAPLSLLDDDVLHWLRERHLEGSFKVRTATE